MFKILQPDLEAKSLKRIKDIFVLHNENKQINLRKKFEEESFAAGTTQEALKYRLFCSLISDCLRNGWSVQSGLQGFSFEAPKLSKEEAIRLSKENALDSINNPKNINFINKLKNPPNELKRKSIDVLVDDGNELRKIFQQINKISNEEQKVAELNKVFKLELQHCFGDEICEITNIRLLEIWEYFRLTWSIPYGTANSRTMPVLIRNSARPNKPVIGIFQFSQPSFNNKGRNSFLKMDNYLSALKEIKNKNLNVKDFAEACLMSIDNSIKDTRWDDLKIDTSDIKKPTQKTINYLKHTSQKFRKEENLDDRNEFILFSKNDKTLLKTKKKNTSKERSETKKYIKKRSERLSKLLFARKVFNDCGLRKNPKKALTAMIQIPDGQRAINISLEFLRNDIFSTKALDINVCGAIAPYNELLCGKLTTLVASSREVVEMYDKNYNKYVSIISSGVAGKDIIKSSKSIFLCTSSLYEQGSSQYNRLKLYKQKFSKLKSDLIWHEAGFTAGVGTDHISARTARLCDQVIQKIKKVKKKSESGAGHSFKLRVVNEAARILRITPDDILYGQRRKNYVYFPKEISSLIKYVYKLKEIKDLKHYNKIDTIKNVWIERWLLNRIKRPETLQNLSKLNSSSISKVFEKILINNPDKEKNLNLFSNIS